MTTDRPNLGLRGVTKTYSDFRLGPIDLEVEPGRVVAFVGANGAGKSTTLLAIMNLIRPDSGTIEICGMPNDSRDGSWKQHVGFVGEFQGFYRTWSVERNLDAIGCFYRGWSRARTRSLAERFALPLHKSAAALSRGNRAKLALVAALAHSPDMLLLDEPTQGLDPLVRAEVLDALREHLEEGDRSILYSTHVLSDISRLADEIVFLRDGLVVSRDRTDQLTDSWRRVSFRFDRAGVHLEGVDGGLRLRKRGVEHQLVTSDHEATARHLAELGATGVQMSRMTIDEITVEILRQPTHTS